MANPRAIQRSKIQSQARDLQNDSVVIREADMPLNTGRRKTLLGAAAGASVIAWHTPIINSIVLPAHAQTSGISRSFFGASVTVSPLAKANSLLNFLIPEAVAGVILQSAEYAVAATPIGTDGAAFTISLFEDRGESKEYSVVQVVYSGDVSLASGGSLSPSENPCNLNLKNIAVEITSITEDAIRLNLTDRRQSLIVAAGEGKLPTPMCTDAPNALADSYFQSNELQMEMKTSAASNASAASNNPVGVLATRVGSTDNYDFKVASPGGAGFYEGTLNINGTLVSAENMICDEDTISIRIVAIDEYEIELFIVQLDSSVLIPAGSGILIQPLCPLLPNPEI
ncbi:MAG: hypothetical protein ACI9XU_002261 [Arenicella sp.]|jgi:hypothetical protein